MILHGVVYVLHSICVTWTKFSDQTRMDRPVALSAATSSFSTAVLWLLRDLAFSPTPVLPVERDLPAVDFNCPELPPVPLNFWSGVAIGFCLWPLIEILVLCKQWLTLYLRSKVAGFDWQGRLYKVLS